MWHTFILTGKINAVTFNKTTYIIDRTYILWYTYSVVQPIPGNGRRWTYGNSHIFFCDCCGRCDLPSHLQMVRQTQQGQQIAWWMLNHWNKKRRALECISGTSGGSFFVHMEHSHIFFAYWHYSICRSWNQYATAPTLCSINIHQCRTARQRLSSDSET